MKLPNLDDAFIPSAKITDYLLNITHDEGGGKALFFIHFGFSVAEWRGLEQALIRHAHEHEVVKQETTRFGTRYVVEGTLQTPSGKAPQVRVVWFISANQTNPRLVTAYPVEE